MQTGYSAFTVQAGLHQKIQICITAQLDYSLFIEAVKPSTKETNVQDVEDTLQGEDRLWFYNLKDCVYTDEVGQVELKLVESLGLSAVHRFQQPMLWPVLQTMLRG